MIIAKNSASTGFPHPFGSLDATDDDYPSEITIEITADRDHSTGRWTLDSVYLFPVQVTIRGVKRVVAVCEKLGSEADAFFTDDVEAELERQWQEEQQAETEKFQSKETQCQ